MAKKQRSKMESPRKTWDSRRMDKEKRLLDKYGLRRKRELRKAESILRGFRRQARELAASRDVEQEEELLSRVSRLNLIPEDGDLDDILSLTVDDILDRRLQTVVYRKGFANTPKQARQFITHGHVRVDGKRIEWPSFMVTKDNEDSIETTIEPTEEDE